MWQCVAHEPGDHLFIAGGEQQKLALGWKWSLPSEGTQSHEEKFFATLPVTDLQTQFSFVLKTVQ